ncbi:hypothetical protein [Sphingobacterium sp. T2]|nr:hypothetical protein [Sphingobacterium sp. T2]
MDKETLNRSRISQLERINEKGRAHFLGIKGGVFAETLLKMKIWII